MNTNYEKISNILLLLKNESMQVKTESELKNLMHKYNLLFLGSNLNSIYSHDLIGTLNDYFNLDISLDELHKILPELCKELHMQINTLVAVDKFDNPTPQDIVYQVLL